MEYAEELRKGKGQLICSSGKTKSSLLTDCSYKFLDINQEYRFPIHNLIITPLDTYTFRHSECLIRSNPRGRETPSRGIKMLIECQECGLLFKTDNPQRRTCYDCRTELQFIVQFPDAVELPKSKAAKKR